METQKPQQSNPVAAANQKAKEDRATAPSPLSSPSHEFSFTITLHPSPNSTPSTIKCYNKTSPSFALDLAPADDIFFHGHLLPLHLLSHPSISPRPSSDISIDDLSLPVFQQISTDHNPDSNNIANTKERSKSKSFSSLFGLGKWWKGSEEDKKKKKKGFWKKYASMVEPLFFSKGEKEKRDLNRRPYTFSGNSNPRERDGWMRRRGEFSAPASMRTSPTNSGLLLATPTALSSSSDESSMKELQNAIQAAITHCKNSTGIKEDKCKC